jgi:hypothetical protein
MSPMTLHVLATLAPLLLLAQEAIPGKSLQRGPKEKASRVTIQFISYEERLPASTKLLPTLFLNSAGQFFTMDGFPLQDKHLSGSYPRPKDLPPTESRIPLVVQVENEKTMTVATLFERLARLRDAAPRGRDVVIYVRVQGGAGAMKR